MTDQRSLSAQKKISGSVLFHGVVCFLFLVIPILVSNRPSGEPFLTVTPPFIRDILGSLLLLVFFYFSYYFLIPKYFIPRKFTQFVLWVSVSLFAIMILPPLLTGRWHQGNNEPRPTETGILPEKKEVHPMRREPPRMRREAQPSMGNNLGNLLFNELRHHLYLFVIVLFFSALLRTREYLASVNQEKLKAELLSLKSQINPHFLFNTLNSIYVLSIKKDDKASEAIVSLSELMRYAIKDAHDEKIPLSKEISYIRSYVTLQKARLGNTGKVGFECSGNPKDMNITPLILITYIENAFKYGINPDVEGSRVDISLQVTDGGIKLLTSNTKVLVHSSTDTTGIGMANTKERLKLLYPNRHILEVKENDNIYRVELTIELT